MSSSLAFLVVAHIHTAVRKLMNNFRDLCGWSGDESSLITTDSVESASLAIVLSKPFCTNAAYLGWSTSRNL